MNVKEKYQYVKKERNSAYERIRELTQENRHLDKRLYRLTQQLDEIKSMQNHEIYRLRQCHRLE